MALKTQQLSQDFTEIEIENGDIGIGPGCDDIIIKIQKNI